MKDPAVVPKNILLVSDNQHEAAEINNLLNQSSLDSSGVTSTTLNENISEYIDGQKYDAALISIVDANSFTNQHIERLISLGVLELPTLLVTAEEDSTAALHTLRERCDDSFTRKDICPALLACSIEHLIRTNKLHNKLQENEIRYSALLDTVTEGVITCDGSGTIEALNPMAAKLLGIQNNKALGKRLTAFLVNNFRNDIEQYFKNALAVISI